MSRIGFILYVLFASVSILAAAPTLELAEAESLHEQAKEALARKDYVGALPLLIKVGDAMEEIVGFSRFIRRDVNQKLDECVYELTLHPPANPPPGFARLFAEQSREHAVRAAELRKKHVRPKSDEAYDVRLRELGNFEYDFEKGGEIPKDVMGLDGAAVRLRGYMMPLDDAKQISAFALTYSPHTNPALEVHHVIVVHAPKGKKFEYNPNKIIVEGRLRVRETKEDGIVVSLFELEDGVLRPIDAGDGHRGKENGN